jgi:murein DD-endopeptidase MepM/ murein hydrolase activator NlpD
MKRPRTIFAPFALVALVAIGFAMARIEREPATAAIASAEAQSRKGGAAPASVTPPERVLRARLMLPVVGVTRRDLHDTWGEARAEGRTHQGIDIMAPQGARVQAVADGRIVKFFNSERGGVTVYQFDSSERFVYYYAHLSARAAGLAEGDPVRQGATIGYVGMTGNAPVPHLHFEIQRLTAERRWWRATSMNPYPYLMTGEPPA